MKKFVAIGNLGRDPDISYTNSGSKMCKFSIAVNERSGGQEDTSWWNITAFDKKADLCQKYLRRGSKIYIEGNPQQRTHKGSDGVERISFNIILRDLIFLGGKRDGEAHGQSPQNHSKAQDSPNSPINTDDDIPF